MQISLFHVIDDVAAIVRLPKGVYKQTKVYRRNEHIFIPHSGGYVRLMAKIDGTYGTTHPDVKVTELSSHALIGHTAGTYPAPIWRGGR